MGAERRSGWTHETKAAVPLFGHQRLPQPTNQVPVLAPPRNPLLLPQSAPTTPGLHINPLNCQRAGPCGAFIPQLFLQMRNASLAKRKMLTT